MTGVQTCALPIFIEIEENLPDVSGDETRLGQILLNLIDNAIKYNQEAGQITITAKEIDSSIQIDIADTGVGIPEEHLPRLFERFYRVDKARSRELGGTGLGLAIVKHIVQALQGQISVQSILGKGSTFSFAIPKA